MSGGLAMESAEKIVRCRKCFIALLLILLLSLCGCADYREKPTGEPAYIRDLQLINNTVYWLERTDGSYALFRGNADEKERIKRFPDVAGIAFCEDLNGYLYAADGVLSAYDPESDTTAKICDLYANALLCATEDYVLASTESGDLRIEIANGSKQAVEHMPRKGVEILDINGNVIVFWDHNQSAICKYDCDRDSTAVLYSRARNPAVVMVTAIMQNGWLYYAESAGGLHKISMEDESAASRLVSVKSVIAMARAGDGMVLAIKERSDLVFYLCSGEDAMTELAVWHDANYIVNGSCLLSASDNKIACAVTSEQQIFEFEIPDN